MIELQNLGVGRILAYSVCRLRRGWFWVSVGNQNHIWQIINTGCYQTLLSFVGRGGGVFEVIWRIDDDDSTKCS